MGCGDVCPIYPGKRYVDWELDDPKARTSVQFEPSAMKFADESKNS